MNKVASYKWTLENLEDGALVELYSVISRQIRSKIRLDVPTDVDEVTLKLTRKDIVEELESRGFAVNWLKK